MQNPSQFSEIYLKYLEEQAFTKEPAALYDPINYILSIGGKRLRPQLVLWGAYLFGDQWLESLPVAHAVEVFHNFTLVHDDIMDEAALRRGQPTVHARYNSNTAILSGDVMLIYAYDYLLRAKNGKYAHGLCRHFNRMAIEVCEGQQYDMEFETRQDVSLAEYLKMIELKTAALLGGALFLGGFVTGIPENDLFHLEQFGRKMGIAFQIQDDLLDSFGDPAKFGKQVGGDIIQNKKTFLYLKALEAADLDSKKNLLSWYAGKIASPEEKVREVKTIFEKLSIKEQTLDFQQHLIQEAYQHLDLSVGEGDKKEALRTWADALVVREV